MKASQKNTALIATIGTTVLCGLPGLCLCVFGGMFAAVGMIPGSDIDIGGSSDPQAAIGLGVGMLCVSLVLMAIPAGVGFFTLRKKPEDTAINAVPMTNAAIESDPFANDAPTPPAPSIKSDPFENVAPPPQVDHSPFDDDDPIPPPS